jgi:His-Xaa-Ser system protein HxsD
MATSPLPAPAPFTLGHGSVAVDLSISIYGIDAIFRAAYKFTDRVYIFLAHSEAEGTLVVTLTAKDDRVDLGLAVGDFLNELIDQRVRANLEVEAGPIRELIVAQAFSEGNLLDPQRDDGDYQADPLGIGRSR